MVLVLVAFGDFVFPLTIMLWRPKGDPKHKSKNDLVAEFLNQLEREARKRGVSMDMVDIVFDSQLTGDSLSDRRITA